MPGSAGLPGPRVRLAGARHGQWGHVFQWYAVSSAARKRWFAGRKGGSVEGPAAREAGFGSGACAAALQRLQPQRSLRPGCIRRCGRTARAAVHGLVRGLRPRRPQTVSGGSAAQRCPRRARAAQTQEPDGISSGRVGQRGAGRCLLRASLLCSSAAVPTTSLACVREKLLPGSFLSPRKRFEGWVPLG